MTDMNANTYPCEPADFREERILAQKIYDRCRLHRCVKLGPAISNEKCECIITHPDLCAPGFGSPVFPGRPVRLPNWIKSVAYIPGSFKTQRITILDITPSPLPDRWDIGIEFVFDFSLRLFGENRTPVKIICCPCSRHASAQPAHEKDFLRCSSVYITQVTLSGPAESTPMVASDILPQQSFRSDDSPHVLIQSGAQPAGFKLIRPEQACRGEDLFDDIYHEPFRYIYAYIALLADIMLFRFVCAQINLRACPPPKTCDDPQADPCARFSRIDFPQDLFQP